MAPAKRDRGENPSEPLSRNQKLLRLAGKIAARRVAHADTLAPSEIERLRQVQKQQLDLLQKEFPKARIAR